MQALLAKYLAKPTNKMAEQIDRYHRRHPFAEILLDHLEKGILADALAIAQISTGRYS